jgi:hypothetical protein
MKILYPINLITSDVIESSTKLVDFLNADYFEKTLHGQKLGDMYLLGSYCKASKFIKIKNEYISDNVIARGCYLPQNYTGIRPLISIFKEIKGLNSKPTLISECHLNSGELIVVPESSEVFALVSHFEVDIDSSTEFPESINWFSWFSHNKNHSFFSQSVCNYFDSSIFLNKKINKIEALCLKEPFLEAGVNESLMGEHKKYIQIHPIMDENDFFNFVSAIVAANFWVYRSGDTYSQRVLDILEWSKLKETPEIVKQTINKLNSNSFISKISKLCGVKCSSIKEIIAYRMSKGEGILNHTDGTYNGELIVRFNWLLQNPSNRTFDLRFWNPESDDKADCFVAIPNSASIFFLGIETPHDLEPMPENCDKDRYNIILTFGHN